jgi:hypothetical protein
LLRGTTAQPGLEKVLDLEKVPGLETGRGRSKRPNNDFRRQSRK